MVLVRGVDGNTGRGAVPAGAGEGIAGIAGRWYERMINHYFLGPEIQPLPMIRTIVSLGLRSVGVRAGPLAGGVSAA